MPRAMADEDPAGDVRAVYCLSESRHSEVVQAAIAMGVGSPVGNDPTRVMVAEKKKTSRAVNPAELRTYFPDAFKRVCTAVISANAMSSGRGGAGTDAGNLVSTLLMPLLLAGIGAGFTLFGQFVERSSTRRNQRKETLLEAVREYQKSVEEYLDSWQDDPRTSHQKVAEKRGDLVSALRLLPVTGELRRAAGALGAALPLAEALPALVGEGTSVSTPIAPADRRTIVAARREKLDEAVTAAEALTSTRPGRPWRVLARAWTKIISLTRTRLIKQKSV